MQPSPPSMHKSVLQDSEIALKIFQLILHSAKFAMKCMKKNQKQKQRQRQRQRQRQNI